MNVDETLLKKLRAPLMHPKPARPMAPVAGPLDKELLIRDFAHCELMFDSAPDRDQKGMRVYRAKGSEIPNLLLELGRLREETFRTVGEGTGLERDIDTLMPITTTLLAGTKVNLKSPALTALVG